MGIFATRRRMRIGGLRVVIKVMSTNLGSTYKRYGCVVIVRARRRRRAGVGVVIQNHYFVREQLTAGRSIVVHAFSRAVRSRNSRRTAQSEYAFAYRADPFLPIVGVLATVRIRVGDDERTFSIARGSIDENFSPNPVPRI